VKRDFTWQSRWIVFALLLAGLGIGAWIILSMPPKGRLNIQFLDYRTNTWGDRALRVRITNEYEFPVYCSVRVVSRRGTETPPTVETIEPNAAIHHRISSDPAQPVSGDTWRIAIVAHHMRRPTALDNLRTRSAFELKALQLDRLSHFVRPRVKPLKPEIVESAPIPLPGVFTEPP